MENYAILPRDNLFRLLTSPLAFDRVLGAQSLLDMGDPEAVAALEVMITNERDAQVIIGLSAEIIFYLHENYIVSLLGNISINPFAIYCLLQQIKYQKRFIEPLRVSDLLLHESPLVKLAALDCLASLNIVVLNPMIVTEQIRNELRSEAFTRTLYHPFVSASRTRLLAWLRRVEKKLKSKL